MSRKYEGVRAKSASSIEISFYYKAIRCFETIKLKPTATNLKRAYLHRMSVMDAISNDTFDYAATFPDSPNLKRFLAYCSMSVEKWLELCLERWKEQLKASTYNGYRKIVRNVLIPEFGNFLLSGLSRKDVKRFVDEHSKLSRKRLSNILSPLRTAYDEAVQLEHISQNPLDGYKLPKTKRQSIKVDPIDPFDSDERQAIYAAIKPEMREFAELAWWTGLRLSEQIALLWTDVDWVKRRVSITKATTQEADEPEAPKTSAGLRYVKLLDPAIAALRRQKQFTFLHPSGHIFVNPKTDEPWKGDASYRMTIWTHAIKRAGVRYRYPYQCRHTYASMLLMAGENIMWVSKQLGHTDWAFTARTYSRWIDLDAPESGMLAVAKWQRSSIE